MLLEGRRGLVTGAAGGIGRGIALVLAAEGASVVVSDLEAAREGGVKPVAMIEERGGREVFTACDVTRTESAQALGESSIDTLGGMDFAVDNAGVAVVKPFADF